MTAMKIGYYCPLAGESFLSKFNVIPVDLKTICYSRKDEEFCNHGSNKCSIACWMSALAKNDMQLDGIILTNCCHEQEQLADFLSSYKTIKILKLNIPRIRTHASVKFLADQLESISSQFTSNSSKEIKQEQFIEVSSSAENLLPVIVFGIAVPPWVEGLFNKNGLHAIMKNCCGIIDNTDTKLAESVFDTIYDYAQKIIYSSMCIRNTADELIRLEYNGQPQTKAVFFAAMEYCTSASYGYVRIKDYFAAKNIPVFKITITDWNKPSDNQIAQIESLAHILKGEI